MRKILLIVLFATAITSCKDNKTTDPTDFTRPVTERSSKWISKIIEYRPAPGQFINQNVGSQSGAQSIVAGKRGMVTLGGFGGYIVFMFDHTVVNEQGVDFVIHGNAFEGSSEVGAVMVAFDSNGNGQPDTEEWFDLKGSEYAKSAKDYQISYARPAQTAVAEDVLWSDNKGGSGKITAIEFHKQCYYPLFLEGNPTKLSFTGNMIANTATMNQDGTWVLKSLDWGYVDNFSSDYKQAISSDRDTELSNKFDIANAVDKNGNSVTLKGVDFIKVYTCLNQEAGWIGEASTEICGAISLSVK